MRFCTECGTRLEEDEIYCTECGTKQTRVSPVTNSPVKVQTKIIEKTKLKKPMSKKNKWIFGSIISISILLVCAHLFLSMYFDPIKNFQAMDQAIVTNNAEEFLKHIHFESSALLNKEEYFNYIKDNEWESIKEQYIDMLEREKGKNHRLSQIIFSNNGERLFNIQQEAQLLFYKSHVFQAVPTKLIGSTNVENTEITISDLKMILEGKEATEIAKIYPGEYTAYAEAENIFGSFTEEYKFEIIPDEEQEIAIEFEGTTYAFNTDQVNATLFVNGQDTGRTFSELDSIGPIPEDAEFELHAEWENSDGEVVKTDIMTMEDIGWYGYDFIFGVEEVEDADVYKNQEGETDFSSISEVVLEFRDAYEIALNNKDFSQIESYLYVNSAAYNELKDYIEDLEDNRYHYDFKVNDILNIEESEPQTYVVTTNEIFTFTNHLGETLDYDRTKEYILNFHVDSFKISNIEYVETNRNER